MKHLKLKAETNMFCTGVSLVSVQFDLALGWLDGHLHTLFGECPRWQYSQVSFLGPFRVSKQEFFSVVVGVLHALSAVFSKLWYKVRVGFNTSCPSLHSEEWGLPPHCEAVLCLVWGLVATLSPQGHNVVVVLGESHGRMTDAQPAPGFRVFLSPASAGLRDLALSPSRLRGGSERISQ